jgi:uncharacterized lipoprotein YajG
MLRRLVPPVIGLLLLTGCVTDQTTAQADKAKTPEGQKAPEEATEVVYTTGSIIGRKVKKGQKADGDAKVQGADSKGMEQMQRDQLVRALPKDNPGGQ